MTVSLETLYKGEVGEKPLTVTPAHAANDLGLTAGVVSLIPLLEQRREQTQRSKAMLDITRYMFQLYRVSRHTFTNPENMHVFETLWGIKAVMDPEEPIKYLRADVEPIDLLHDQNARARVEGLVHEGSIDIIASSGETRPWIANLGRLARGEPSIYDISA